MYQTFIEHQIYIYIYLSHHVAQSIVQNKLAQSVPNYGTHLLLPFEFSPVHAILRSDCQFPSTLPHSLKHVHISSMYTM
jgi:hypothetical protein